MFLLHDYNICFLIVLLITFLVTTITNLYDLIKEDPHIYLVSCGKNLLCLLSSILGELFAVIVILFLLFIVNTPCCIVCEDSHLFSSVCSSYPWNDFYRVGPFHFLWGGGWLLLFFYLHFWKDSSLFVVLTFILCFYL